LSEGLLYLDTSAIVKLVLPEPETEELLHLLSDRPERVTSGLARVELFRAVRRTGGDGAVFQRAGEVLARLGLIEIGTTILDAAAHLEPRRLRSLDAIHLATALSLGHDLEAITTYDSRLAVAAEANGLNVLAPG
jgi:predicted nucleic acid-binding protein